MSMSREEVVRYIDEGNFEKDIFAKVDIDKQVTVINVIGDCYGDEFLRSPHPENWIRFMQYLNSNPPRFLKSPGFMLNVFKDKILESPERNSVSERCGQYLIMMLNQLEQNKSFTLTGNQLFRFGRLLSKDLESGEKVNAAILSLIEIMPDDARQRAYAYLLDQYVGCPRLLYEAYQARITPDLLDRLAAVTNDASQSQFIGIMRQLIPYAKNHTHRFAPIDWFISDMDSNSLLSSYLATADERALLSLKRISTRSEVVLEKISELIKNDKFALQHLHDLRGRNDDAEILNFTNRMNKFLNGFGSLGYDEGLLTAAQRSERKPYKYDPVVLDEGQFKDFLATFSKAPLPIRKRFIQTGLHWVAGDIEIDKDGFVRVAIFDSLGKGSAGNSWSIYDSTLSVMKFISLNFPGSVIYFGEYKRQNTSAGCSVYAQDDTAHLFNLETHLQQNIFDYFSEQKKPLTEIKRDGVVFYGCDLPASLMLTAQTEKYIEAVEQGKLPNPRVSKKEHDSDFLSRSRGFFKPKPYGQLGRVNTRLEEQLTKMAKQNAIYLLTHDALSVKQQTEKFTLENFKNECKEKRLEMPLVEDDNPPLHRAIRERQYKEAIRLLSMGENPYHKNARGRSAMDFAFNFLTARASERSDDYDDLLSYLLLKAVQAGDYPATKKLLQQDADPNNDMFENFKEYPLHTAARSGSIMLTRLLLEEGADPALEDHEGINLNTLAYVAINNARKHNEWSKVAPLLLCKFTQLYIEEDDMKFIEANVQQVVSSFLNHVASLSDSSEKIYLYQLAFHHNTILGSLLSIGNSTLVQALRQTIENMVIIEEMNRDSPSSSPRIGN